jgi:hypothetical protein
MHPKETAMADSSEPRSAEESPFDHLVDDGPARQAWADWAAGEIGAGRSTEDVAADLVAHGWSSDDAEHICEQARRATRHLRGGTSREEVARAFGVGDPNVTRSATPFAKPDMFAALGQFIRALFRFRSLKNVGKRK